MVLYLCMNISVASGAVDGTHLEKSPFVVSDPIEVLSGPLMATIVTVLILWVAFASVFSAGLGHTAAFSFHAAKDGAFFPFRPPASYPQFPVCFPLLVLGGTVAHSAAAVQNKRSDQRHPRNAHPHTIHCTGRRLHSG